MTSKDRVSIGIVVSVAALAVTVPLIGKQPAAPPVPTTSETARAPAPSKPVVRAPKASSTRTALSATAAEKAASERRQRATAAAEQRIADAAAAARRAEVAKATARTQQLLRSTNGLTAPVQRVVTPKVAQQPLTQVVTPRAAPKKTTKTKSKPFDSSATTFDSVGFDDSSG